MIKLTFSKAGQDDILLTEDDLFDFEWERGCFSGETFELGGVCSKSISMIIDNNTQRFGRGTFANTRIKLEIDGTFCGFYNAELPKRRNGIIELTAYDDMLKLDVEYPSTYDFPQVFASVYAQCVLESGLVDSFSLDSVVLNALFNNGVISHEYTDYIYANSCRNLVSGMAEWNGGFAHINDDNKLQVDVFSKTVSKTFYSGDLMALDYSDETVTFSKIKTSQKNKTYEKGDDSGYTLVINNQYISYGLSDEAFGIYLGYIYDYYKGFTLTPMTFTLAEPDFDLQIGDRISVVDEEEDVTVTGNISKIVVTGNCLMEITCGGFGNVAGVNNYKSSSSGQISQVKGDITNTFSKYEGVGRAAEYDKTSEYFNDYTNNVAGVKGKQSYATARGFGTSALAEASSAEGYGGSIDAKSFAAHTEGYNGIIKSSQYAHVEGQSCEISGCDAGHAEGYTNKITGGMGNHVEGGENVNNGTYAHVEGHLNKITNTARGAHAEGANTAAFADGAHSEGMNTTASDVGAHAEGSGSTASGSGAHAEGMSTTASGGFSHAEGMGSTATGAFSHAGGTSCTATGDGSFAGGSNSQTKQFADFAYGDSVITDSDSANTATAAFGRYNDPTGHIFSVGNGKSGARSNAFAVDADGTIHCTKIEGAEVGGKVDISASEEVSTAMLTVTKDDDTGAVTLAANVNISRDAGNSLFVGGDGGLYADPRALVQYYYTDEITFREGEFDIAYHVSGVAAKSTFAVTEDNEGRITEIKQKLDGDTGRSIKINYE